jgi:voltage-gated potassium channel
MASGAPIARGRVDAFVRRHVVAWEGTMALLAMAYLAVDIYADGGNSTPVVVIAVFSGVFLGEFSVRLLDAPSRRGYLRHHWLDLVSSLPLVGGLRSIRLLRLLRLLRAAEALNSIEREEVARGRVPTGLSMLIPALFVVWFAAALCFWTLEHNTNPDARTFGDALYWAFMTMTTVGYGTNSTLHADTRVLAGVLIFLGIGMVSVVSAHIVSALLHDRSQEHLRGRLDEISDELRALRAALVDRADGDA